MEEDGRHNCFNGLIKKVNNLDDVGDSSDGRALVTDARDFVDKYIIVMKNRSLSEI